jgi:hypothetical protein
VIGDAPLVFQATRLAGAPLPTVDDESIATRAENLPAAASPLEVLSSRTITEKTRQLMLKRAERASQRGNQVRSAILQWQASRGAWPETAQALKEGVSTELDKLASRLQNALGLDPKHADAWRESLAALLPQSAIGFWNANARLLYDLQKVCLAYERETYVVDLLTWGLTFGRRPLRRPLPNQPRRTDDAAPPHRRRAIEEC